MRKEQKNNQAFDSNPYPEDNDEELIECRMGCGRMFNANVLPKH